MRSPDTRAIHKKFSNRRPRKNWSFEGEKSINRFTHGYHRYPAKFLPQIVQKLITNYTKPNDKIADVFAGCGTTLVECKINKRSAIGVDINPVAQLITNAKINPILPENLKSAFEDINKKIVNFSEEINYCNLNHERIDYWFRQSEKNRIAFLFKIISEIEDEQIKVFFLCAISNILKNCSKWLQKGTKPQIDPNKKIPEVFATFKYQVKKMITKNKEFYEQIQKNKGFNLSCEIKLRDARNTGIRSNSINAIITSPPYVTSYEYADIHQLSAYWLEYISDLSDFRKKFIGTFYSDNKEISVPEVSPTAKKIVSKLAEKEIKWAREVANYFQNMFEVAQEMYRISAADGVVCLVIGNTEQKGVSIKSAEVFAEMLFAVGYDLQDIIKRSIPHKINPTIRDKNNGRFTKVDMPNSKKVYPNEYIIIGRKSNA